jgi:hypothetical protein
VTEVGGRTRRLAGARLRRCVIQQPTSSAVPSRWTSRQRWPPPAPPASRRSKGPVHGMRSETASTSAREVMRSTTAVRRRRASGSRRIASKRAGQRATRLLKGSDFRELPLLVHGSRRSQEDGRRFRWSEAGWWAWEELNLRLHPYQQSGAYRYATLRFRRSCATVRGEVMRCYIPTRTSERTRCDDHRQGMPATRRRQGDGAAGWARQPHRAA